MEFRINYQTRRLQSIVGEIQHQHLNSEGQHSVEQEWSRKGLQLPEEDILCLKNISFKK